MAVTKYIVTQLNDSGGDIYNYRPPVNSCTFITIRAAFNSSPSPTSLIATFNKSRGFKRLSGNTSAIAYSENIATREAGLSTVDITIDTDGSTGIDVSLINVDAGYSGSVEMSVEIVIVQ